MTKEAAPGASSGICIAIIINTFGSTAYCSECLVVAICSGIASLAKDSFAGTGGGSAIPAYSGNFLESRLSGSGRRYNI